MTDREKLIELIKDGRGCPDDMAPFGDEVCSQCRYEQDHDCDIARLADYLISHGVKAQKWIPVTEPPKVRGEYIVMIKGAEKATTLWYYPNRKTWEDEDYSTPYPVTHWMPLPEPPEDN